MNPDDIRVIGYEGVQLRNPYTQIITYEEMQCMDMPTIRPYKPTEPIIKASDYIIFTFDVCEDLPRIGIAEIDNNMYIAVTCRGRYSSNESLYLLKSLQIRGDKNNLKKAPKSLYSFELIVNVYTEVPALTIDTSERYKYDRDNYEYCSVIVNIKNIKSMSAMEFLRALVDPSSLTDRFKPKDYTYTNQDLIKKEVNRLMYGE